MSGTVVSLPYRILYGFRARDGLRAGEAERMRWGDIDLERGAVALDVNKTDDPRSWALDPGVARAVVAWRTLRRDIEPDDRVFTDEHGRAIQIDKLAGRFRAHLLAAKVDRAALHEKGPNRRLIRAHDLRATFITVALANGRTEAWVMDRTGYTTSAMLNRYRRAARSFAELGQGDMRPLHHAIPELRAVGKANEATKTERESDEKGPEKGPNSRAEVAEWQTRRIQNPLLARV
jgi:integrase